jgi:hypothetical protein
MLKAFRTAKDLSEALHPLGKGLGDTRAFKVRKSNSGNQALADIFGARSLIPDGANHAESMGCEWPP